MVYHFFQRHFLLFNLKIILVQGGLQSLLESIKEKDPDKVSVRLASSLDTIAELELLQVTLIILTLQIIQLIWIWYLSNVSWTWWCFLLIFIFYSNLACFAFYSYLTFCKTKMQPYWLSGSWTVISVARAILEIPEVWLLFGKYLILKLVYVARDVNACLCAYHIKTCSYFV